MTWRVCSIAVVLLLAAAPARAQLSVGHVKSLFIERFTRFIDWPGAALSPGKVFVVCIQGSGETADDLARVASTRSFKERTTAVRRLRPAGDLHGCHLLYLAASERGGLQQVLRSVGDRPILTVSDTPGFAEQGVAINLYQEGRFMRFEINTQAVKRSKLVFSSQLLRLGKLVGEPGGSP